MLFLIPVCAKERERAVRLAKWIAELGGDSSQHDCLLEVHTDTTSEGIIEPLRTAFRRVAEFSVNDEVHPDPSQYVIAANLMWRRAVHHIRAMNEPAPWFWLEPDSVPLVPDWREQLEAEYQQGGKPFMHEQVQAPTALRNSGIGVYPAKVADYTERLWELHEVAWDVLLSPDFMPHTHHTRLIQDSYWMSRDPDKSPEFPDDDSLSFIRPGVVLFHRSKGGSLIQRLRNRIAKKGGDAPCPETSHLTTSGSNGAATSEPEAAPASVGTPLIRSIQVYQTEDTIVYFEDGTKQAVKASRVCVPGTKTMRTAQEQAKINLRMARVRASKLPKKQLSGAL